MEVRNARQSRAPKGQPRSVARAAPTTTKTPKMTAVDAGLCPTPRDPVARASPPACLRLSPGAVRNLRVGGAGGETIPSRPLSPMLLAGAVYDGAWQALLLRVRAETSAGHPLPWVLVHARLVGRNALADRAVEQALPARVP